jgi:hypothetical protein
MMEGQNVKGVIMADEKVLLKHFPGDNEKAQNSQSLA